MDNINPIAFALLGGALFGFIFGGLFLEHRTKITTAEAAGFTIGSGILQQEWRCHEVTTHNTLEDAKARVERYQERAGK